MSKADVVIVLCVYLKVGPYERLESPPCMRNVASAEPLLASGLQRESRGSETQPHASTMIIQIETGKGGSGATEPKMPGEKPLKKRKKKKKSLIRFSTICLIDTFFFLRKKGARRTC